MRFEHFYLRVAALAACFLVGCASQPVATTPDKASLTVKIVAEPNPLVPAKADGVDSYGGPGNAPRQLTPVDYAHLDGIVVWLDPVAKFPAGSPSPLTLTFTTWDRDSETSVCGAEVGATITIANRSSSPSSFFSVSKGNAFDLGKVPPGGKATFQVQKDGQIDIFCDLSDQPFATILAVRTPYIAAATGSKPATFSNVIPGTYHVRCWTSRLPGSSATISLAAGQSAETQLRVGVTQLPKLAQPVTKGK